MIALPPLPDRLLESGPPRLLLGYSGGLDSTVLMHLLHALWPTQLRALHVHHGLHPDAGIWARHCETVCEALGVALTVVHVDVDPASGLGLEGAARAARHAAFREYLDQGEVLALAHHRDDQAETFLLRALRASGPDGLAAMLAWREFGSGWLWRPLLDIPRSTLRGHADAHALHWIEDPSNQDTTLDRGFLRQQLMPLLRQRWPQADAAFARSAGLQAELLERLTPGTQQALHGCLRDDGDLDVTRLQAQSQAQQAAIVRHWIAARGLPPLPASGIAALRDQLLPARMDAEAEFRWAGAVMQRWRERLHSSMSQAPLEAAFDTEWGGSAPCQLPTGDYLQLTGVARFDHPLQVTGRRGGERIQLPARTHTHALKHVLQEAGVPPWQRARMPLLRDGDTVLAAGELLSAQLQAWLMAHGAQLRWHRD